jgi:gamma-glutamylputrescine oxidase
VRLSDPPARSYYAASAPGSDERPAARAPLEGDYQADIGVIGGGIAGLSTALHLARRGYRVAVLEAREVGYGASGRSGGQTIFGMAAGEDRLVQLVGRDDAHRLFDLTVEGLDLTGRLISEYAIDCDYRPNHVHVAVKPRHTAELKAWWRELREEYGYDTVELLDRAALQAHVRSDRYLSGLLDTRSGHVHPLKFTQGLARAAESAGVRIFEGTLATGYHDGRLVRVRTPRGELRAGHLVLCGNAYLGSLAPSLARRILGVGTYIIATERMDAARARQVLPSNAAVSDINWVLDYFRLSADDRMLFGGRVSYSTVEPPRLAQSMRNRLVRVFPALQDLKVEYSWGGYVDITRNRAADFGRLAPNVYYMQGFSGHGMVLTVLGGKLVAEAVAGTAERFDLFARIPHRDFPGGPLLRRPSLVLAMMLYRLKDML